MDGSDSQRLPPARSRMTCSTTEEIRCRLPRFWIPAAGANVLVVASPCHYYSHLHFILSVAHTKKKYGPAQQPRIPKIHLRNDHDAATSHVAELHGRSCVTSTCPHSFEQSIKFGSNYTQIAPVFLALESNGRPCRGSSGFFMDGQLLWRKGSPGCLWWWDDGSLDGCLSGCHVGCDTSRSSYCRKRCSSGTHEGASPSHLSCNG